VRSRAASSGIARTRSAQAAAAELQGGPDAGPRGPSAVATIRSSRPRRASSVPRGPPPGRDAVRRKVGEVNREIILTGEKDGSTTRPSQSIPTSMPASARLRSRAKSARARLVARGAARRAGATNGAAIDRDAVRKDGAVEETPSRERWWSCWHSGAARGPPGPAPRSRRRSDTPRAASSTPQQGPAEVDAARPHGRRNQLTEPSRRPLRPRGRALRAGDYQAAWASSCRLLRQAVGMSTTSDRPTSGCSTSRERWPFRALLPESATRTRTGSGRIRVEVLATSGPHPGRDRSAGAEVTLSASRRHRAARANGVDSIEVRKGVLRCGSTAARAGGRGSSPDRAPYAILPARTQEGGPPGGGDRADARIFRRRSPGRHRQLRRTIPIGRYASWSRPRAGRPAPVDRARPAGNRRRRDYRGPRSGAGAHHARVVSLGLGRHGRHSLRPALGRDSLIASAGSGSARRRLWRARRHAGRTQLLHHGPPYRPRSKARWSRRSSGQGLLRGAPGDDTTGRGTRPYVCNSDAVGNRDRDRRGRLLFLGVTNPASIRRGRRRPQSLRRVWGTASGGSSGPVRRDPDVWSR